MLTGELQQQIIVRKSDERPHNGQFNLDAIMQVHQPRFFQWEKYPFRTPPELSGQSLDPAPVVVVGAGPVGLAMALGLAQQGIQVVVLECRDQLSDSSRTLAVSRRSMQILDRLGVADAFRRWAITRERNYLYCGKELMHSALYEQMASEKFPDISVLQQPWTEKCLLDGVLAQPLIDLRWLNTVTGLRMQADGRPVLDVHTPEGDYELRADYVVAADGARGQVRRSLGLEYEEIGDGVLQRNFVICDFEMKTPHPVARRLLIRPPFRPKSAVILHRQPFDTWRLDYALEADEDLEEALKPENVAKVVEAQIKMLMGDEPAPEWRIVWISSYRPMSRSLSSYREGRIFFAGDAAHQTPIFGGRGMNQGLLDASNLTWRLASVVKGLAPPALLDGYDAERRPVIVRNLHAIGQATLCMTAPTRGATLMRNAVFDLMPTESFVHPLVDAFNANRAESLLTPPPARDPAMAAQEGSPLPDARLGDPAEAEQGFLHDQLLPHAFTGLYLSDDGTVPESLQHAIEDMAAEALPFANVALQAPKHPEVLQKLGVAAGAWVLVRPDGYVAARLDAASAPDLKTALARAVCRA